MDSRTRLEPLAPEPARQLQGMLNAVRNDGTKALALDERGHVTTVVSILNQEQEHVLGDLDVHA